MRYVPIHAITHKLGPKQCAAFPAYHALTGCDTTSSLSGIGKKKSLVILNSSQEYQERLSKLGEQSTVDSITWENERNFCAACILTLKGLVQHLTVSGTCFAKGSR